MQNHQIDGGQRKSTDAGDCGLFRVGRKDVLDQAAKCILEDRNDSYGPPEDSFASIAHLWSWYKDIPFTSHDVGIMMALMKMARIKSNHAHLDSHVDAVGYIACATESKRIIPASQAQPNSARPQS